MSFYSAIQLEAMDQPTSNPVPSQSVSEPIPDMGVQKPAPKALPKLPSLPTKNILIAIVVLAIIGAVALLGKTLLGKFTGSTPSTGEARPISLVYWGMWEENDNLRSVIKQFESANPGVTIQYSSQSPKDYSDRLISACGRGQCPDIFRFHSTWASQYNQRGLLSPLPQSVMSNSEFEQTFYPVASTDLKTPSGYVGMPLMFDGLGLYINKRILQASGKSIPTTWDELRTLANELTIRGADGSVERSGAALGTANNVDHFSDILTVLILQNSGSPAKPEAFGSTASVSSGGNGQPSLVGDALTFYTQFARSDKIWNETLPNSTYAFAIEKAAMILAPAWRAAEIKKINPNFAFEVYPIPQLPGKPKTYANYWVEGVSKTSKEQDTAWKFLKYLAQKDTLEKLNAPQPGQAIKEVYPRQDMASLLASDPYAGAIVRQAPSAQSFYMSSRTFDKGINDKMIAAYAEIVSQMSKGTRYDELAVKFASTIQEIVTSYGIKP